MLFKLFPKNHFRFRFLLGKFPVRIRETDGNNLGNNNTKRKSVLFEKTPKTLWNFFLSKKTFELFIVFFPLEFHNNNNIIIIIIIYKIVTVKR